MRQSSLIVREDVINHVSTMKTHKYAGLITNMQNSPTVLLAKELINQKSITPNDNGCQDILIERLKKSGFEIKKLRFEDVDNFWAIKGNGSPVLVFAGHTDVVPPGPVEKWQSDPFKAEIRDGKLYGRGAADMKGSIAAMITACEKFIANNPHHKGSIAFLITSDEEGIAISGTKKVVEYLQQQKQKIDYCIVGEASSEEKLGDIIKVGRRGTLNGKVIVQGKQGHIAYPQLADNPIHNAVAAIKELAERKWDKGNEQFQPTSFQISNIHAGTGADNVIPGQLEVIFNFRYSTESTAEQLQEQVEMILKQQKLNYEITWRHSGKPFLTKQGELVVAAKKAIEEIAGVTPKLTTHGGTSDGRFIAELGCQIVEIGPNNRSIHHVDEHVSIEELDKLSKIYEKILTILL